MYFADLTRYSYMPRYRQPALNCGWLDADHPFPTAEPDPALVDRLRRLALQPAIKTRGHHECEFCPVDTSHPVVGAGGVPRGLGSSEIRALHPDGTLFAAPELIVHYVGEHHYAPPQRFVDAVEWSAENPDALEARVTAYLADVSETSADAMAKAFERGRIRRERPD